MIARLFVCAGAALLACTSHEPPPAPEPTPAPPPAAPALARAASPLAAKPPALPWAPAVDERVLLRDGGRLWARPAIDAPAAALHLSRRPDTPLDGPPPVAALHVVGVAGDWVEVDEYGPLMREECGPPLAGLDAFALRAFVHRDDLVPALAREIRIGLSEGTSVRLQAGTAAWPRVSGLFAIDARGVAVTVPLPADALTLAHRPGSLLPGFPDVYEVLHADAKLVVGGEPVGGASWLFGRRPVGDQPFAPIVTSQHADDLGVLLSLANRCIELTARSDLASVFSADPNAWGNASTTDPKLGFGSPDPLTFSVAGLDRTTTAYQVAEGTPFTFLGSVPAKVRRAFAFTGAPTARGDELCFAAELGGVPQPELQFCFARAAVRPLAPIRVTHRIVGDVDPRIVQRMIDGRALAFFSCDEQARKARPDLAGTAVLRLDLTPSGSFKKIAADTSGLPGGAVYGACLARYARDFLSPTPRDGRAAQVLVDVAISPLAPLPPPT